MSTAPYIILPIVLGFYIFYRYIEDKRRKERRRKAESMIENYPRACKELLGGTYKAYHLTENQIYILSNQSSISMADDERRLKISENIVKAEEERRKKEIELHNQITELFDSAIREKTNEIIAKYPIGYQVYMQMNPACSPAALISSEEAVSTIALYQKNDSKSLYYSEWNKSQSEYNIISKIARRRADPKLKSFICEALLNEIGEGELPIRYKIAFYQHYFAGFCNDTSLDYRLCPELEINRNHLSNIKNLSAGLSSAFYNRVLSFIEYTSSQCNIIFADSGMGEDAKAFNSFHFEYLKSLLKYKGIRYWDITSAPIDYPDIKDLLIVEVISSYEQIIINVSSVFKRYEAHKPRIAYFTLFNEFSSRETRSFIHKKQCGKFKGELNNVETEIVRNTPKCLDEDDRIVNNVGLNYPLYDSFEEIIIDIRNRLLSSVSIWDSIENTTIRYRYLLNYYPITSSYVATEQEWNDRQLIWDFKNTHGKTSDSAHDSALKELVPRIAKELKQTFGSDLPFLTLLCIPASSHMNNQRRFEEFSKRLCQETCMINGYDYVNVSGERVAKHSGEGIDNKYSISIDQTFFDGKNVILFDDIITRGDSIKKYKQIVELKGATVIAAFAIGKTKHESDMQTSS